MAASEIKIKIHCESHEDELDHTIIIYADNEPVKLIEENTGIAYKMVKEK